MEYSIFQTDASSKPEHGRGSCVTTSSRDSRIEPPVHPFTSSDPPSYLSVTALVKLEDRRKTLGQLRKHSIYPGRPSREHHQKKSWGAHQDRPEEARQDTGSKPRDSHEKPLPTHGFHNLFGEPETPLLLQPVTKSISQEQLRLELKSIYSGLVMVENKCNGINRDLAKLTMEDPSFRPILTSTQWQALIALHKTLLHDFHDFFLVSQHPVTTPNLTKLAARNATPAWLWHGIHNFLEVLRYCLPESLDHMLAFIYTAYSMMTLLYETVPAFADTWIECFGDLGRYRMVMDDDGRRDREVWLGVSLYWYKVAAEKSPHMGHLAHHLAILSQPFDRLSLYLRALISITQFESVKTSLLTLLNPLFEGKQDATSLSSYVEIVLIKLVAGILYDWKVESIRHIQQGGSNFKLQGMFLMIGTVTGLCEFGRSPPAPGEAYGRPWVERQDVGPKRGLSLKDIITNARPDHVIGGSYISALTMTYLSSSRRLTMNPCWIHSGRFQVRLEPVDFPFPWIRQAQLYQRDPVRVGGFKEMSDSAIVPERSPSPPKSQASQIQLYEVRRSTRGFLSTPTIKRLIEAGMQQLRTVQQENAGKRVIETWLYFSASQFQRFVVKFFKFPRSIHVVTIGTALMDCDLLSRAKSKIARKGALSTQLLTSSASAIMFATFAMVIPPVAALPMSDGQTGPTSGFEGHLSTLDYVVIAIGAAIFIGSRLMLRCSHVNKSDLSLWLSGCEGFVWWATKGDDRSSPVFLAITVLLYIDSTYMYGKSQFHRFMIDKSQVLPVFVFAFSLDSLFASVPSGSITPPADSDRIAFFPVSLTLSIALYCNCMPAMRRIVGFLGRFEIRPETTLPPDEPIRTDETANSRSDEDERQIVDRFPEAMLDPHVSRRRRLRDRSQGRENGSQAPTFVNLSANLPIT